MTKTYKAQLVACAELSHIIKSDETDEIGWNENPAISDIVRSFTSQRLIILNEHGTPIATYPNMPNTHCIDLSDVRKWIDNGCSESVELEVEYDTASAILSEPIINPLLTNNTVKMVWGEVEQPQQVAEDIEDAAEKYCIAKYGGLSIIKAEYLTDCYVAGATQHPINWDALMDKFFKEHTELKDGVPKICSMPMAIFNWFKNNVK